MTSERMTSERMTGDAPVTPGRGRGYQVTVAGVLGPVLRAALADLDPTFRPPSSTLRLQVPADWTAGDVAAAVQAQGLEILTLRPTARPGRGAGERSS